MLEDFLVGGLFYCIALLMSLWIYQQYSPLSQRIFYVILLSWFGHFLGGYIYTLNPSDSYIQFFMMATPDFLGLSTQFVETMTWYVREYITGDSFQSTIFFFSAFSFLGSVLWYLLYLQLAEYLGIQKRDYLLPALILMCWPSYLLFTAGIGKDSLCFMFIPMALLSWNQFTYQRKNRTMMMLFLMFALGSMIVIRPYLLMIAAGAYFLSTVQGINKLTFFRVLFILFLVPFVIYAVQWVLAEQANLEIVDLDHIASKAQTQQLLLSQGSSFPYPATKNTWVTLLLLPYGLIMNLVMPLFIFANNITGVLASIENIFLVYLLYQFIRARKTFRLIKLQLEPVKVCFYFFVVGMAFMGLSNTNLGLAMRQKSMYVPAFLVIAMLVWAYQKQGRVKQSCLAGQ